MSSTSQSWIGDMQDEIDALQAKNKLLREALALGYACLVEYKPANSIVLSIMKEELEGE